MNKLLLLTFLTLLFPLGANSQCWKKHDSGAASNLAIRHDGTLWAWGLNNIGQLGVGNTANHSTPVQVGTDSDWKEISWGYHHALAIKDNGTLWAWGWNRDGQIGDNTLIDRTTPKQIGTDNNWKMVAGGFSHSVALKTDGTIWAWGMNDFGQIGINSYQNKILVPTMVGTDQDWVHISAGEETTLAIKSNGTLWSWGNNVIGQIGGGLGAQRVPNQIGIDNDWKTAEAGAIHGFAIKNNGTLWGFGLNSMGMIGDGTTVNRLTPVQVGTDSDWKQVVPGIFHSVGIKTNGSLWTWGGNDSGQLGDGSTVANSLIPKRIGNSNDWTVSSTYLNYFSSVLKSDDTIWTFGSNIYGNLGDGTTVDKNYPVKVVTPANQTYTISASAPAICGQVPVVLTSSLPTGNQWSTGATTQSITVTVPGTYTLNNPSAGCGSPASITIGQVADPNLQITGNLKICHGESTTLTASNLPIGYTYLWSNGATTPNITVSMAGTYALTVTSPEGCQFSKSVDVFADSAINIVIATPQTLSCANPTVILDATTSTYDPSALITWTATNGGVIVSGGNTLTPTVSSSGTYTLTITNASGLGCSQQKSVTVIGDSTAPSITLVASKLRICQGESVVLTASGATSYQWVNLSGSGHTQTVYPNATTTYTVSGIGTTCSGTNSVSVTVEVDPIPMPNSLETRYICPGELVVLDATVTGSNLTYHWNTGETSPSITINNVGVYQVTIDNGSCSRTYQMEVANVELPQITNVLYQNNSITIYTTNSSGYTLEYSIDGGSTWQNNSTFDNVEKNKLYDIKVRIKDKTCEVRMSFYTFFFPNSITPNNDEINDTINFSNLVMENNFKGIISDRYGATVFEPSTKTPIWFGVLGSKNLPTATYWYHISWNEKSTGIPVTYKGWILLKNK